MDWNLSTKHLSSFGLQGTCIILQKGNNGKFETLGHCESEALNFKAIWALNFIVLLLFVSNFNENLFTHFVEITHSLIHCTYISCGFDEQH